MEYYCYKKERNIAICNNMDGPIEYYSEVSQRKTSIIYYLM